MTAHIVGHITRNPVFPHIDTDLAARARETIARQAREALPTVPGRLFELLSERGADAFEVITSDAGIRVHRAAIERENARLDEKMPADYPAAANPWKPRSGIIRAGVRVR